MPNTKNAMIRYQMLDRLLSDRYHNYSLDDLTEEVSNELVELDPKSDGVVRRTIEKDIKFLECENTPPAEIERYTVECYDRERRRNVKKHCLRYEDQGFSIFNKDMSDEERELLGGAMSLLGHFDGLPNLDRLESLRWKARLKSRKQPVISLSKTPVSNSNILGQLFTAIINKQVVRIVYHPFKQLEPDTYMVYPYMLKEYNRRWYLISASVDDMTITNMALDRMKSVTPLPAERYVEFPGNVNKLYDDVIGVTFYPSNPLLNILFWVSDESDDYVITKPIHHSLKEISGDEEIRLRNQHPSLQGGTFFTISCRENYELYRELMSFGKELVVLSPETVKNEIIRKIKEMNNMYELVET